MPKKIALVDIDGCLIQDGKLNKSLVARLQSYDEIIFFTQRNDYLQVGQIPRAYHLGGADEFSIISTPQAFAALEKELKKSIPIRVSTTLDPIFGRAYYSDSSKFEERLQQASIKNKDSEDRTFLANFNQEVATEREDVTKAMKAAINKDDKFPLDEYYDPEIAKKVVDSLNIDNVGDIYYPQKKTAQYRDLIKSLDKDAQVDYFDDNEDNLKEILDKKETLSIVPTCYLVKKQEIQPVKTQEIQKAIGEFEEYKRNRELVEKASGKQYFTIWARKFKKYASATNKISAAEKFIKLLKGEPALLTEDEKSALKDSRLGKLYEKYNRLLPSPEQQQSPEAKNADTPRKKQ